MSKMVLSEALGSLCNTMMDEFGDKLIVRSPILEEKERSLSVIDARSFKGYFRSWDCASFVWDNCPQHKVEIFKVRGKN